MGKIDGKWKAERPQEQPLPPPKKEEPKQQQAPAQETVKKKVVAPWLDLARKKFSGKKETDPEFSKFMVPKWKLVGLNLNTISTSWAAWCGLAMAVALSLAGLDHQKDGALAINWDKFGVAISWQKDGIPEGAIVRLNHKGECKSSAGNHVTVANGSCTAKELSAKGATFDGFGGNQNNTWKVSTYPVYEICSVRWPKDYNLPPLPVKVSDRCSSAKKPSGESTR